MVCKKINAMNKYRDWNVPGFAEIVDLERFAFLRPSYDIVGMTSGGYDPIHPGHQSSIIQTSLLVSQRLRDASCSYGKTVVIVNGDSFLQRKKGKPFQDLRTRCLNVAATRGVDVVIPFDSEDDTVIEAIRSIKPTFFTKGGDRKDISTIPEWSVCQEVGCEIIPNVGLAKEWSSSNFLEDWGEFTLRRAFGIER
jgi:bifunctional ADP-heptose synthase (sugar kinase/adenylyltransferase)